MNNGRLQLIRSAYRLYTAVDNSNNSGVQDQKNNQLKLKYICIGVSQTNRRSTIKRQKTRKTQDVNNSFPTIWILKQN